MGLFSKAQAAQINEIAKKSKEVKKSTPSSKISSVNDELIRSSNAVEEYFKDSPAILITSKPQLHEYVSAAISVGIAGIDTETTGLDRNTDYIVGASLYYPGGVECYIALKHRVSVFETFYKNQLSYEDLAEELQRFVDNKTKLVFANANYDLYMIWKDLKVDLDGAFYYDVILAWRCLKEDELHNDLKHLYNKYVLKGKGDPKRFSDFFSPKLFPYSKPDVAKLYAANDAKITYDLFVWQYQYSNPNSEKCKKNHLENIATLIWDIEFPLVHICQLIERAGMYVDQDMGKVLQNKYHKLYNEELKRLEDMVDDVIEKNPQPLSSKKPPFTNGQNFNPKSTLHVQYLLYTLMNVPKVNGKMATGKEILNELDLPIATQIARVRSLATNINTFVDKLPDSVSKDGKIHADFRQIGAATGRMCIAKGTPISILNGTKPIENIVPGDYVYCYDSSGNIQLSKVKHVWLTGKNVPCVDITWQSSGKGDIGHLICTPEHLILKKDGTWVRADSLKRYDKVVHLRRTVAKNSRPHLYGWNGIDLQEQDVIKYSVFECSDSQNYVVHHIDENPLNNGISNVKLMKKSEHSRYHAIKLQQLGITSSDCMHTQDSNMKRIDVQRKAYIDKVLSQRDDLLSAIKLANGRISHIPGDYTSFIHKCEICGINVREECAKYNPRYWKRIISEDEFISVYHQYNGLAIRIVEHFGISYDKFYSYCKKYGISRNHMIQSVVPAGQFDVYDIEVEGYHNFIASEICVHNSSAAPNLQNIPSRLNDIRHLFRADPRSTDEVLGKSLKDDEIEFVLDKFCKVEICNSNDLKFVKDIAIGDILVINCNDEIKNLNVCNIYQDDNDKKLIHVIVSGD